MNKGIFYGISVGPGDPELMTLKAVKQLNKVKVLATPRTKNGKTMALDIASQMIDMEDKLILYLDFAMTKNQAVLEESHQTQAKQIEKYLAQGMDVAMLNIGDASLYSTFSYINAIITEDGYECVIIPGVTSFCAVAASLQQSLTTMNEPLTILPGGMAELKQGLLTKGSKVIMKPASAIGEIKNILRELDLVKSTKAVCDCGLSTEKVYDNIDEIPEKGQYFVTMLVQDSDNKKNHKMEG